MPCLRDLKHLRKDRTLAGLDEQKESTIEVQLVQLVLLPQGQSGQHTQRVESSTEPEADECDDLLCPDRKRC